MIFRQDSLNQFSLLFGFKLLQLAVNLEAQSRLYLYAPAGATLRCNLFAGPSEQSSRCHHLSLVIPAFFTIEVMAEDFGAIRFGVEGVSNRKCRVVGHVVPSNQRCIVGV